MPETDERLRAMITETHDTVLILKTVLLGQNGDSGLVGKVGDACSRQDKLDDKQDGIDKRLTKVEVRSGIVAGLISAAVALGAWLANVTR